MSDTKLLADYVRTVLKEVRFEGAIIGLDGYRQIVETLRTLKECELELLYLHARREMEKMSASQFARQALHLWFFSHPSFAVFTKFLADDNLVNGFLAYLFALPRCRKRKNQIKLPKLRAEMRHAKTSETFIAPYLELVRVTLDAQQLMFAYGGKRAPRNTLCFNAVGTITEDDRRAAHVKYFIQEIRELSESSLKNALSGKPISKLISFLTTEEIIEIEVSNRLPELYREFGVPATRIAVPYQNYIEPRLFERVTQVMLSGTWFRFASHKTTPCRMVVDTSVTTMRKPAASIFSILYGANTVELPRWMQIKHGCLSVGLKVHALGKIPKFFSDKGTPFKLSAASEGIVLPPVANAPAAITMLQILSHKLGEQVLDNEKFQIQVCSPGRLTPVRAAYLGTAFYLGSDRIRMYDSRFLKTTHDTGKRLVIYGAGVCDRYFDWCGTDLQGNMMIREIPMSIHCRTDVLWCHSIRDVYNVNLIATLLAHNQYDGYWKSLGQVFQHSLLEIMERHQLQGILQAPWVKYSTEDNSAEDQLFADTFLELSAYALSEAKRLEKSEAPKGGILAEVNDLLTHCYGKVYGGQPW